MAKKESNFKNMVLALFMVTALASLALGGVYNLTKERIEIAKAKKLNDALKQVLPVYDSLVPFKTLPADAPDSLDCYLALNQLQEVGMAVKTYTNEGYSGYFVVLAGFNADGSIFDTRLLEHKETPGLGDKMDEKKSDFPIQFKGKQPEQFRLIVEKDGGEVDAITAATISSRAFCDAVQRAYDYGYKSHAWKGGTE